MITVACVNHGNYLSHGEEYVDNLRAMVARAMPTGQTYTFRCLKDIGPWGSWWSKIELFRPGMFPRGRVLYLDLDSVITGPLAPVFQDTGTIYLTDWGWRTHTLCSSVMVWDTGAHVNIFEKFNGSVPKSYRGDQDWITSLGEWNRLPPHLCRSYRYHSVKAPPPGCSVVNFHGLPKPHQLASGWVPQVWRGRG